MASAATAVQQQHLYGEEQKTEATYVMHVVFITRYMGGKDPLALKAIPLDLGVDTGKVTILAVGI